MVVTGQGTQASPYLLSVKLDPSAENSLSCTANGLLGTSKIHQADTNTVNLSGDGTTATPLTADVKFVADNTNELAGAPYGGKNLVKAGTTGIYVSCEDIQDCVGTELGAIVAGTCLVYDDDANKIDVQICPAPNGIECLAAGDPGCAAGGLSVTPSTDVGNQLAFGSDGHLFVPGAAVAAGSCITITGTGVAGDPYVVNALVDPACPLITCGPGGLCVTPTPVAVVDTATVDLTLTGSGQPGDPWTISAVACAPRVVPANTSCIGMIVSGGADCNDPFVVSAIPVLSPDPCNIIECRGDGLFVFGDAAEAPQGVGSCYSGGPFGPFNGSFGPTVVLGPFCATITNPSACRNLDTWISDGGANSQLFKAAGKLKANLELSVNGGPFITTAWVGVDGPGPGGSSGALQIGGRSGPTVGPGGSATVCVRFTVDAVGVVNGTIDGFAGCVAYSSYWAR